MARESDDPISAAIIATEKEIAGDAWGNEETDALDPTGDRSLEDLGEGLEGQHEAEEDDTEGEVAEGESDDAEGEADDAEGEAEAEPVAAKAGEQKPVGREPAVPPHRLREANERAKAAEAREAELKAAFERSEAERKAQLDLVMRELAALKAAAPRTEQPKAVEPPKPATRPDLFENPDGVYDYFDKGLDAKVTPLINEIKNLRVENSMAIAHAFHKDVFEDAWKAVNSLNVDNPQDRATVQSIYASPNPGEALVKWHKREKTRAEVGDDVAAYRERIAKETREALLKDPEFRKQLVADMRGEAAAGENGQPRTTTRLPRSLNGAAGSNVGVARVSATDFDGSDQSIADAAWR